MEEYSHFLLGSNFFTQFDDFQPNGGGQNGSMVPNRNIQDHYTHLKASYDNAIASKVGELRRFQEDNLVAADGIYLDFNLVSEDDSLKSLDSKSGSRLMNVSTISNEEGELVSTKATVYLQQENQDWFDKKLEKYLDPSKNTPKGYPSGYSLINNINTIQSSSIGSFFSNPFEFSEILPDESKWYEVWIANGDEDTISSTYEKLRHLGIVVSDYHITFREITIFLIQANLSDLEKLPFALNYLSEIRISKQPSCLLTGNPIEHQEWTELLEGNINIDLKESSPVIGLIDTGVNNAHPLIRSFLTDESTGCVIGGFEHIDEDGHGTEMSGICLYGDLTELIYNRRDISIKHKLASIKIFSEHLRNLDNHSLYGAMTEEAVEKLEEMNASIFCLAITEDDENCFGVASSWSAGIDKILYHDGNCDRLMLVAGGNIQNVENLTQDSYQDCCINHKAQSPSQALNAITVGAYTEKVVDTEEGRNGVILAPPQEISPFSRTSCNWTSRRIKPEIVMEGGNVLMHRIKGALYSRDLSLITTSNNLNHSFACFNATSAATALAARLAVRIQTTYPDLSSLAIRALMIHSAEWTEGMMRHPKDERLCMYGYGVPSESHALNSRNNYATYIFENSIVPYGAGSNGNLKYAGFQLLDLPWPTEVLQNMGEELVRLKVTLSYYVDPAPGKRGRLNRYRYHNASLNFDLKAPTESIDSFVARHNKLETAQNTATTAASRWEIGIRKRQSGTIQSDWLECTAAELAECGQIMIYPGPGWWKEQKFDKIENLIKYALVVSIETTETPIYGEIAQIIANKIQTQIQV